MTIISEPFVLFWSPPPKCNYPENCALCHERYHGRDILVGHATPQGIGHIFHRRCFRRYIARSPPILRCPLCRLIIPQRLSNNSLAFFYKSMVRGTLLGGLKGAVVSLACFDYVLFPLFAPSKLSTMIVRFSTCVGGGVLTRRFNQRLPEDIKADLGLLLLGGWVWGMFGLSATIIREVDKRFKDLYYTNASELTNRMRNYASKIGMIQLLIFSYSLGVLDNILSFVTPLILWIVWEGLCIISPRMAQLFWIMRVALLLQMFFNRLWWALNYPFVTEICKIYTVWQAHHPPSTGYVEI